MFRLCVSRIVKPHAAHLSICPRTITSIKGFANSSWMTNVSKQCNQHTYSASSKLPISAQTMRSMSSTATKPNEEPLNQSQFATMYMKRMEAALAKYESICQSTERVTEANFARTFNILSMCVEKLESQNLMSNDIKVNIALMTSILLRSCGHLMLTTPEKGRELLAGNVWQFMKEKKLPLDISHYNSLIRVLNDNKTDYDPKKILQEINEANLTPDTITYQRLLHRYCLQGDIDEATNLLSKMKELGHELNENVFASLILGYSKQENPPPVSEMFELMTSNGVEPTGKSYTTAIVAQAHKLKNNPEANKELERTFNSMMLDEVVIGLEDVVDIIHALTPYKADPIIYNIYEYYMNTVRRSINNDFHITATLLKVGDYEMASSRYWMNNIDSKRVYFDVAYLRLLSIFKNIPKEFVMDECAKLVDMEHNTKAFYHLYYYASINQNYDLIRASVDKLKELEGRELKCQYYWPLLAQAKDEETMISVLKNDIKSTMHHDDILDTFVEWVWPRFFNNKKKLFEINKEELHYDTNLVVASLIKYSLRDKKMDGVVDFFANEYPAIAEAEAEAANNDVKSDEKGPEQDLTEPQSSRPAKPNRHSLNVGRMLVQIAEHTKDPEVVEKAFKACHANKDDVPTISLSALVKVHLLNDDIQSAMDKFEKIYKEFNSTPCKPELISYCLQKQDADNLQKIMNISTSVHGEANSLYDLAVCCIRTGKLKQAQKIFAGGVRVQPFRVIETAITLATHEKLEAFEIFVDLVRDMVDVDQDKLFSLLLNRYERTSNADRALKLWNKMQEENFQPSKKSMIMIARLLERNNIPVPFEKPVMNVRFKSLDKSTVDA